MEPYIVNLINDLIDSFIDDGEVEFVSQFCIPLPMNVIQDRLGFPKKIFRNLNPGRKILLQV